MRMPPDLLPPGEATPAQTQAAEATPAVLDAAGRALLFGDARTCTAWQDRTVPDTTLQELYDLLKLAPTSANSSPARFVFIRTAEGKAKLKPALSPGNIAPTMAAPVTCLVCTDSKFYDRMPTLFPQADIRGWFADNWSLADQTATRNGTLQGAYLILAARAVGLDCGPMSGFDNWKVDEAFLSGTDWRSNFVVNLGYGDRSGLGPRNPRLTFDEACRLE